MQPTAEELIGSISWALDNKVAPHVSDKWGSSTLRSVSCLLQHLVARVGSEGPMLFEDNADLDSLCVAVGDALGEAHGPSAESASRLRAVCARTWREPGAYPSVESLAAENHAKRVAVDDLVAVLGQTDDGPATRALELVDAYLRRRLERDQPFFLPAFAGSTF